ncbi:MULTISPECIES: YxeA family protein [unclassified Bacillus cereus group]|uniref:YxeA family protein n=1 Tax=unclassified Bacillus cereus group TaxID=2750818 RepID=UPI001F58CDBA|nr:MULTISPECIES: YxeA family protein [unclassified Bacillus cereus group]
MKRYILFFSLFALCTMMYIKSYDLKHFFIHLTSDKYYVQITDNGKENVETFENNEKPFKSYQYKLKGFDKNGEIKTIDFTAYRTLRNKAFLCVYHDGKNVVDWDEIKKEELPEKAKVKLNI